MQVFENTVSALDTVITAKQLAAAKAAAKREKALASIAANAIAGGVSDGVLYADRNYPSGYNVVTLADNGRGRNARGTAGHKRGWGGSQPKGAKRARKQNTHVRGAQPRLAATRWANV